MEMMKVCLPNDSKNDGVGGGWTFRKNLIKYASFQVVNDIESSNLCLVSGVTMITGSTFERIRALGKKIVIRLDGIPEPWRNPKIDIPGRLLNWCHLADGIIYQSGFTKRMLGGALGLDKGVVIVNGADQEIFKPDGETVSFPGNKKILSVLWRQDPNKRWDEVLMRYREYWQENKDSYLVMVGDFPNSDYNFGLIFGEQYIFIGKADEIGMAKIMRSCDEFWFPSFADPCPNTLIEALCCGMKVKYVPKFGGASEIMKIRGYGNWREILDARRMANDYYNYFKEVLSE